MSASFSCHVVLKGDASVIQAALDTVPDKTFQPVEGGVQAQMPFSDFVSLRDAFKADIVFTPSAWARWLEEESRREGEPGWCLYRADDLSAEGGRPLLFLEANDASPVFSSDEQAWRHVVGLAGTGDERALLALQVLGADDGYVGRPELVRILIDARTSGVLSEPDAFDDLRQVLGVSTSELDPRICAEIRPYALLPVKGKQGVMQIVHLPDQNVGFDITDRVLSLSIERLHLLDDDDPSSTELVRDLCDFEDYDVRIVDEARRFFGVDTLSSVEAGTLETARKNHFHAVELEQAAILALTAVAKAAPAPTPRP